MATWGLSKGLLSLGHAGPRSMRRAPVRATAPARPPVPVATHNTGTNPTNPLTWCAAVAEYTALSVQLGHVNRTSTAEIVGNADVNVSLTSYGNRIATVWRTIETIGAGTVKPRRIILWLDDAAAMAALPPSLKRLQARGLEIRRCLDYGPHKKYFPYVNEILPDEPDRTLVTADDDVYYPPNWLDELLNAHRPNQVTAFRARIRTDGPYRDWPMCATTEPSDTVFATGTSGVAYPPAVLRTLKDHGDEFAQICPRADDFWLHYAAIASGVPVRQVRATAALWWSIPVLSNHGLWDGTGDANDAIAAPTRRAWLPV
ncbi:hypothetical protein SBI67_11420 [Mycolicibacterium sp. 120266]|uniref:hypothetical protein n=1 Tax=Mycolicibacterium sp. 120266 TaxID=3090601 RepID=UPI00299E7358|nr:hypothetical protein [Mycolicibacterium sp. 120266]MDX1872735.1 hypothetical protein [Mycolicibacterium sp. 120266]